MSFYKVLDHEALMKALLKSSIFNSVLIERTLKFSGKSFVFEEISNQISGRIEYFSDGNGEARFSIVLENGFQLLLIILSDQWLTLEGAAAGFLEPSLAKFCVKERSLEDFS